MITLLQGIASVQGMLGVVNALCDRLQTQPIDSFEALCGVLEIEELTSGYTGGLVSSRQLYEHPETGRHISLIAMKGCSLQPRFYPGSMMLFTVSGVLYAIVERRHHTLAAGGGAQHALRIDPRHLLQPWATNFCAVLLESERADRTFEAMTKDDLAHVLRLDRRDPHQLDPSWDTLELPVARTLAFRALELNPPPLIGSSGRSSGISLPPPRSGRRS